MDTDGINSVTAQEMRNQLSDLLNRASYLKEPTLVTRQNKAVAVLISVEDWEQYTRLKKASEIPDAGSADHAGGEG
ncbi:type II toxin-antitoxin system Phd/YefM family antitoxin [Salmonirosea aquatica]|uniref:Antitoxin n=1 Tax=Salmonirosea aquatica TaxID=2654236 RepID=A0A7C9BM60_9BACT|nr:type II toxin-antitoxin system prevent-host-death family antitoxin [Cytophagaceae bacterium SJW1-29]